ncbi:unnamed protein product [Symbiodinium natans]|uniref:Uncharacterized protein n=1 Tax=Symbiodinium natans TaxID=878477 RepID=A0A812SPS1_9DINO|nr:unnamed protein product [Symbiodinium natans]
MSYMFYVAVLFNQPIGYWNTSAVTSMCSMFYFSAAFNQPIGLWNASSVRDTSFMFFGASAFDQPVGLWDMSSVADMRSMFRGATAFNHEVGSWNTAAVRDMSHMFNSASAFNRSIASWNTSRVRNMSSMFLGAAAFNQPIGSWNTSAVEDLSHMFSEAVIFDQPIGSWNIKAVDLSYMFFGATAFNHPIGMWNTSRVTDMQHMFHGANVFNVPLGSWDTGAVKNMRSMFQYAAAFNQPLGGWNTSLVQDMSHMFSNAKAFNRSLTSLDTASLIAKTSMFEGTSSFDAPPCRAGFAPAANGLGCQACAAGRYAAAGASACQACPAGTAPTKERGTCLECPAFEYSPGGTLTCHACHLPLMVVDNQCAWWHLPLLAVGIASAVVAARLVAARVRARRASQIETRMKMLYDDLWEDLPGTIQQHATKLQHLGVDPAAFECDIASMRALQSERAGVSMRYLLSSEFMELATKRTGKGNPSFIDMKTAFWLREDPVGQDVVCPRDGRPGCALVDWIPRSDRREQTHFMSWTWRYSMTEMRSALEMFRQSSLEVPESVFFFMCFFVNNQHRIIVEESVAGSDNLEEVFESNLRRIGRMVAILDTWEEPVYLTRIWTIYEQFVASTLQIQVVFVMPEESVRFLQQQIYCGKSGVDNITACVRRVDSARAGAWKKEDEDKVKSMIQDTVGFEFVDRHVTEVMVQWIGGVVEATFHQLLDAACAACDSCDASESLRSLHPSARKELVRGIPAVTSQFCRTSMACRPLALLISVALPLSASSETQRLRTQRELRAAVVSWERGSALERSALRQRYGEIADWDVREITNMSGIFKDLHSFNEDISRWNTSAVIDMSSMFAWARAFDQAIGSWNTSAVRDMSYMFRNAEAFNQPVGTWDTSGVKDMCSLFWRATAFNQPLSAWDTSAVHDMSSMFYSAAAFNQPIGEWDTSAVKDMKNMFSAARAFDQPIGSWNTSSVRDMSSMFAGAHSFNQAIGLWDTSAVRSMESMFHSAGSFNQALSAWNTSAVQDMSSMFEDARAFDEALGSWTTSALQDANSMFRYAVSFNQPLKRWDTSSLQDMSCMFCHAARFNESLGRWDTSSVKDMTFMFLEAAVFNQPIGSWSTSSVRDMNSMFKGAESFNQPIGSWDTSAVTSMESMFEGASSFNQPLGSWNITSLVNARDMFEGTSSFDAPPCRAGFAPAANGLGCQACAAGRYAAAGAAACQACPAGTAPTKERGTCLECPAFEYSPGGTLTCHACHLPLMVVDNQCAWWHLPLLVVGIASAVVAARLVAVRVRARRASQIETRMKMLYDDLWEDLPGTIQQHATKLQHLGVDPAAFERDIASMRALQSERAGVSMRYLLSIEFMELATKRTGKGNPSFIDMKTAFWLREDPIGQDVVCPRDGRPGCALVDWLPRSDRREQTHFMSWTWRYSMTEMRSALEMFRQSSLEVPESVFFFMCFFVNNQHRIIVEESVAGSDNLEEVFESNLRRIGRMVAILDTWEEPVYLTRIWTIYEQFVASTLQIQVVFVMPEESVRFLQQQIYCGKSGVDEVTSCVSCVDSERASAWKKEDEDKVKALIRSTVGFQHLNRHVREVMIRWIRATVQKLFRDRLNSRTACAGCEIVRTEVF